MAEMYFPQGPRLTFSPGCSWETYPNFPKIEIFGEIVLYADGEVVALLADLAIEWPPSWELERRGRELLTRPPMVTTKAYRLMKPLQWLVDSFDAHERMRRASEYPEALRNDSLIGRAHETGRPILVHDSVAPRTRLRFALDLLIHDQPLETLPPISRISPDFVHEPARNIRRDRGALLPALHGLDRCAKKSGEDGLTSSQNPSSFAHQFAVIRRRFEVENDAMARELIGHPFSTLDRVDKFFQPLEDLSSNSSFRLPHNLLHDGHCPPWLPGTAAQSVLIGSCSSPGIGQASRSLP